MADPVKDAERLARWCDPDAMKGGRVRWQAFFRTQKPFDIVPRQKRTVDHKTPLCRGGAHSASNLTMACGPCNFKKRHRTEEFLNALG